MHHTGIKREVADAVASDLQSCHVRIRVKTCIGKRLYWDGRPSWEMLQPVGFIPYAQSSEELSEGGVGIEARGRVNIFCRGPMRKRDCEVGFTYGCGVRIS